MTSEGSSSKLSFHYYYVFFLIALVVLIVVEFLYPDVVPSLATQLTALILGATFAAYLTTATYDYISSSTQRREWERQVQMGMWERIYLPFYESLVGDLRMVNLYEYPGHTSWHGSEFTTNKAILEIIDRPYLELLEKHVEIHERYSRARQSYLQATEDLIQSYHDGLFPEGSGRLTETLRHDFLYFAGRGTIIPRQRKEDYVRQYNLLKGRYPDLAIDPMSALQIIKDQVTVLPEIVEFLSAHSEMVESTGKLKTATKKVVQEPYQI